MQYTAALIEYIVTGLMSLIWIALLLSTNINFHDFDYNKYKEIVIIGIFPLAYISGIFIDVASSFILKKLGNCWSCLFEKTNSNHDALSNSSYTKSAEILSHSITDTIRTMEAYVSRDRIARGMALNSFLTCIGIIYIFGWGEKISFTLSAFIITIISLMIRVRLKSLSETFKTKALDNLIKRNLQR